MHLRRLVKCDCVGGWNKIVGKENEGQGNCWVKHRNGNKLSAPHLLVSQLLFPTSLPPDNTLHFVISALSFCQFLVFKQHVRKGG